MTDPAKYHNLLEPHESRSQTAVWMTTDPCRDVPLDADIPSGTYTALLALEFFVFDENRNVTSPFFLWESLGTIEVDAG